MSLVHVVSNLLENLAVYDADFIVSWQYQLELLHESHALRQPGILGIEGKDLR